MIQAEGDQQWSLLGHERPFPNRNSKFLKGRLAAKTGRLLK